MTLADTDWKKAGWAGLALLGIAASIIFGIHPGGFESRIGWYLGLLPGVFVDVFLPHPFPVATPHLATLVFWALVFVLSFLWYFGIAFAVIKAGRLLARALTEE